jgi:cephalosporin hydroxylase
MKQPPESRRRFDYERRLLPSRYLEQIEGEDVTELRDIGEGTPQTIGYPSWGLLYYSLYCSILPERDDIVVLETGTNHGFSTIVMAQALKDVGARAVVQTVELFEENVEIARGHVERAGLSDFVRFHQMGAIKFLKRMAATVDHIDFVMLDDLHGKEHVIEEIEIVCPLVSACGGKVYFDNCAHGPVHDAIEVMTERFGGNVVHFRNCSWHPPGNAIWQPSPV